MNRLDSVDAFRIVGQAIAKYGNQRSFARAHGIREQDVSDMMRGRRQLSPTVLKAAGLRRVTYFERIEEGDA
ncbi:helix-turn-helix domain-containing protein [Nguyenibacter vanlangensis]|uniref:Transcriptional regulator n=1 Tax=Nguyenibacter vanlangensis TaxID=1216886 RepID=A0A7Y7M5L5_9PROT|nr:transcriptional regulator [Nguyenibacter vanlangensis]NVN09731.1 transcriptional regulator [Nguyenibacter vanlangensis]